ncbi:HSPB1-associated protein 1 [Ilyodon furcidens]|uniref:HSPB1-associated protein 1 n=1 Tax=Ilyodon furcidens TaxID=33524 RepID=A0ABV0UT27_9TELE
MFHSRRCHLGLAGFAVRPQHVHLRGHMFVGCAPQAMAAVTPIKPFSPEETRWILDSLQQPAVFLNMTHDWPVIRWTAEHLSGCLDDRLIRFRLGRKQATNTPLFETQCSYIEATAAQFLRWTQHQTDVGPFSKYPYTEYWAYADYKYITVLFQDQPFMFELQDTRLDKGP